ncbi:MAG: heme ABC transporter ATP-binding protein [Gammaproteobacteria bacterium]|nr:heme ABC transporter ATP-binding protein [Gammaproteobacteria bacterium]
MALAAQQLQLHIDEVTLLRDVSLSVPAGEVTAILGPNGAGKTSLLRVMSGALKPDRGTVHMGEQPLAEWDSRARATTLAMLPQHSTLNFPFTVEEVVMLGRTPHRTGASRDREVVRRALDSVDLLNLARRSYMHLSGGEKQRVQLARVLTQIWRDDADSGERDAGQSRGERFLLLDEPTASFDLAHQAMTNVIVRRLAQEGVGVLMVLHDLNLAARCADQIVLMADATIQASGDPASVLTPDTIRRVFGVDVILATHPATGAPLVVA